MRLAHRGWAHLYILLLKEAVYCIEAFKHPLEPSERFRQGERGHNCCLFGIKLFLQFQQAFQLPTKTNSVQRTGLDKWRYQSSGREGSVQEDIIFSQVFVDVLKSISFLPPISLIYTFQSLGVENLRAACQAGTGRLGWWRHSFEKP